ncbi:glycosyltransferase [Psychroflexus salinarum]|uniref:Glycosyltransferase n=1 Tax=Psychroflexus salinarum TaxID=546024 RepID=A0ABW3GMG2_9FLAO
MKLSIIIPVYNTAPFLKKCIESCIDQNISNNDYEIILINDGTTDNSHDICESYKNAYSNIHYLIQENSGQSVARNNGVDKAVGNYIWFVDSDDWVESNCLSSILNMCETNTLDILRIGFKKINDEYTDIAKTELEPKTLIIANNREILKTDFVFGPPLHIFRRAFLTDNRLSFYPNIFHEDNEFTPKALYYAKRIGITETIYYYYYTRMGSTTKSVNPKKCFDLLIVCHNLMVLSEEVEDDIKPYINNVISTSFNSLLSYSREIDPLSKVKLKRQIALNTDIFDHMKKSKKIKFKIEGLIFSLFPNNVLKIYELVKR